MKNISMAIKVFIAGLLIVWFIWNRIDTTEQLTEANQELAYLASQIERDDRIISAMLNVDMWDRSKPIYTRWYILKNDAEAHVFTQSLDDYGKWELSF